MSPRHAALLLVAAAAWAPEAEFAALHGSSQATWRGRVDAELDRSLNALPQRTTKDEASEAVATASRTTSDEWSMLSESGSRTATCWTTGTLYWH